MERELRRQHALASMGSLAACCYNAMAEPVFATLECVFFDEQPSGGFDSRRQAKLAGFDYLETLYNLRRRDSCLGQILPAQFEARHLTIDATA